jgi:arylsulfatase A
MRYNPDIRNYEMRDLRLKTACSLFSLLLGITWWDSWISAGGRSAPNFVIIFTDDQGYQDLGVFGSTDIDTPNLDRMAAEGMRFTDFYVGQPVCSASRAALLTGCYPNRVGILGALNPSSTIGINERELTVAELLKTRGYATAIYGKWHLGHRQQFLPRHHGFDDYFGLPYSNDMWPNHPAEKFPDLPLIEGDETIQVNPDQSNLTTWYTEHAVKFIDKNKDQPFFLYLAHNMPHVPLFVSEKYKGKSRRGLYGDVIMEIDWSVGQILNTLKRLNLDEQTLVIFTSDNGPWLLYGDHAGAALPLREGKMTSFEGGFREPCIMRWPGKIPAATVCHEIAMTIDFLPTLAKLAGAKVPTDRILDGKDIWPLLSGQPGARTPHEAIFYYWGKELQGVRSGKWKLHVPHSYEKPDPPGKGGQPGKEVVERIGLELFDLENDIGETTNVAERHPEVVKHLTYYLQKARKDLGDSLTRRQGKNVRPPGRLDHQ